MRRNIFLFVALACGAAACGNDEGLGNGGSGGDGGAGGMAGSAGTGGNGGTAGSAGMGGEGGTAGSGGSGGSMAGSLEMEISNFCLKFEMCDPTNFQTFYGGMQDTCRTSEAAVYDTQSQACQTAAAEAFNCTNGVSCPEFESGMDTMICSVQFGARDAACN